MVVVVLKNGDDEVEAETNVLVVVVVMVGVKGAGESTGGMERSDV